jgi:glc operon protein GlcG
MASPRVALGVLITALVAQAAGAAEPVLIASEKAAIQAPDYGPALGLDTARAIADAARAAAVKLGFPGCTIAITGPDGSLILFEKMDGTTYVSVQFAIAKARTAAISRRATAFGPGRSLAGPTPDLIMLPGGFPIIAGGKTVGGIGISGTNCGDIAIAEAALAVVQK